MGFIKTAFTLLWHAANGRQAHASRGVVLGCCKCSATTTAKRRLRVSLRHGIWLADASAPKGWGIRYERQPVGEPLATYYCGPCAERAAGTKPKEETPCLKTS
jgi:hypothetical protein